MDLCLRSSDADGSAIRIPRGPVDLGFRGSVLITRRMASKLKLNRTCEGEIQENRSKLGSSRLEGVCVGFETVSRMNMYQVQSAGLFGGFATVLASVIILLCRLTRLFRPTSPKP